MHMIELYFSVSVFVLGLIIGSFLNCLAWRLYRQESLLGRSYCPACRQIIRWYDNIPVLSFWLLGGRCRSCRQPISWQYPLAELSTGLLFFLAYGVHAGEPEIIWLLLRDWALIAGLTVIFIYDARWQLVPMSVVWALAAWVAIINLVLGSGPLSLLLSAAIGGGFFALQYWLTAKRGVGEGDIWLGALLGLAFPLLSHLFLSLLIAYCAGAVFGLLLLAAGRKDWGSRLAFGPFLALGAIITLIWGGRILDWYFKLL